MVQFHMDRPEIPSEVAAPFPLKMKGDVQKGFGRGSKELGIPTANFSQEVVDLLSGEVGTGIYFGWATVATSPGIVYPMVMSVGWNPFYKNEKKSAV
jgi:riboflavin kinase